MRIRTLCLSFVLVAGCSKGKSKPPEPFKGPLTVDLVMASKELVKPFDSWDDGFAKLQAKVGAPTKVDGTKYYWAAMQGDDCAYFYVEKEDGKKFNKEGIMVGAVQSPGKYGKDGAIGNRAECLELLGKGAAPEDPTATPPPADGSAVTVKMFVDNAVRGRSKWKGKHVKISGVINSMGGTAISVNDATASDVHMTCDADDGDTKVDLGKPVTVEGDVKIDTWVSGTGEPRLEASLEHCKPAS